MANFDFIHSYGFNLNALRLIIHSYLSNRIQRTKINESYSLWEEILFGVPQGSILGPLLFNVLMCDLFFIVNEIDFASNVDDNTPFVSGDRLDSLENTSLKLFDWFSNNQMKVNPVKCHLLTSATASIAIEIKDNEILNSESEKLRGVKIDNILNFNNHLQKILKKASQKIHVLARITPYMSIPKRKILMNSFSITQFSYCPLVWVCHSRLMDNEINRLHEKCLRIVYSDKTLSFEELLDKDGSVTILKRNLQVLATEMFKVYRNLSPNNVAEIFRARRNNYNLRHSSFFSIPCVKTVCQGSESLSNLGPTTWNLVQSTLK